MRISDWSSDVCSSDLAGNRSHPSIWYLPANPVVIGRRNRIAFRILRWREPAAARIEPAGGIIQSGRSAGLGHGAGFDPTVRIDLDPDARRSFFSSTLRSDEHTSELQSLIRISYAVFCLNKNKTQ